MLLGGNVTDLNNVNIGTGPSNGFSQGRQGEIMASEIHGKWWTAAKAGRHFTAGTAAAGVTIPISSATASTFCIYNPIGSGVNMELSSIAIGHTNATFVVASIMLGWAAGLIVAPTSVTALTVTPSLIGGSGAAQGKVYSAATVVATTTFRHLFTVGATACGVAGPIVYLFDGEFSLAPGSMAHLVGTAAQTQASAVSVSWAEWPIN